MVTQVGSQTFGIVVDGVFHTEEIVVKPMSTKLRHIDMFSGNTILGDGSVIMIIDPNGIAAGGRRVGAASARTADEDAAAQRRTRPRRLDLAAGVPRRLAAAQGGAAVAGHAARGDRRQEDRALERPPPGAVPRPADAAGARQRRASASSTEGAQPLLVFSDDGRSMGLVVDEIVDIVEDRLDIEVASEQPGVLGSAVIKGQATEIIDVGHFLPLAFEDWFRRKEMRADALTRTLLFVDDSPFFRNMLAPVLKAAGYDVTAVARGRGGAARCVKKGQRFDVIVTDIEMPGMNGFELAEAVRGDPRTARSCRSSRCPR